MKYLKIILFIFILVGCTPQQETETAPTDSATIAATSVTEATGIIVVPTETIEATPIPEATATDSAIPVVTTPTDEATATPTTLPTTTPTQTVPFTEGQILFFWDTETPLSEPFFYHNEPAGEPKQDLYIGRPGATPADWHFTPLLHDTINWPDEAPNWPLAALSPDQTKLAFTVAHNVNTDAFFEEYSVYLYDLTNHTVEQIVAAAPKGIHGLTWWPDNQTVTYERGNKVFSVNLETLAVEPILEPAVLDVGRLASSPDGEFLVAQFYQPNNLVIYGKNRDELFSLPGVLGGFADMAWSADSEWLAAHIIFDVTLSVIRGSSAEIITLVDTGSSVSSWSPTGSRLAFSQNTDSSSDLFLWDSASLTTTPLLQRGPGAFSWPIWSPDGTQLAVGFVEDKTSHLLVIKPATGATQELAPMEDVYRFELFGWSPDGQWLVFNIGQGDRSGLYIVNRAGGEPYLILDTTGTIHPYRGIWLPTIP